MQKTAISWTNFTSNPIYAIDQLTGTRGWACTKPSPGCQHCYAETLNRRLGTGHAFTPRGNAAVDWKLHDVEVQRIRRGQMGSKVFLCDMTDLYHEAVPDAWLDDIFAAVWNSHHTIYQTLTKRPARMQAYWTAPGRVEAIAGAAYQQWLLARRDAAATRHLAHFVAEVTLPLPNVWHGVTTEDQNTANERIPVLLETPAAVRWLSCEPLLSPIDLRGTGPYHWPIGPMRNKTLHWVIVGGESGPNRRPMQMAWLQDIVHQCQVAGVKVWTKQDSALRPGQQGRIPPALWRHEFPA